MTRPALPAGRCCVPIDEATCTSDAIPGFPAPLCISHLTGVFLAVKDAFDVGAGEFRDQVALEQRIAAALPPRTENGIVYYIQVGDLVKIGYTTNLDARLATYPPNRRVLALEQVTDPAAEYARHRQFKHLLAGRREWFHPAPDLMEHINTLRPEDRQLPVAVAV